MIVLYKNLDIIDARAYLVNNTNNKLDIECNSYQTEKINPEIFPNTVKTDRKKVIMTVGSKDSTLLSETYHFNQQFVSHYGDLAVWASEDELSAIPEGYSIFIWVKYPNGKIEVYVFDPFNFIRVTRPNNTFANYKKPGASIWSISFVKNDKNLIGEDYLRIYQLN